ncbi:MAG: C-GCAxxG-C-C family (seleno)protein [Spirochaetia bacterium]
MKKLASLKALVENGLAEAEDLNCAETILYAANQAYGLQLPYAALKLAAGFGGGMGIGSTCGALTGSIMAFSAIFVKDRGRESDYVKALNAELFETFKSRMESIDCDYLKEHYRSPQDSCHPIILTAAEITEALIDRELYLRNLAHIN